MHAAFGLHTRAKGRSRALKLLVGDQALDQDLAQGVAVKRAELLEVFVVLVIVDGFARGLLGHQRGGLNVQKGCRDQQKVARHVQVQRLDALAHFGKLPAHLGKLGLAAGRRRFLGRFRRRKRIILTTKLFFYFCYIVVATTIPQIVTDPKARLIAFIVVIFLGQAVYAPFTPGITGWFYPFYPKDNERRARFLIYIQVFSSVFSCIILLFSSILTDALAASPYQEAFIVGFRYFAFLLVVIEVYIQSLAKEPEYPKTERMRIMDVLTVPFRYKKFMLCMAIMFVWNYITYLNSGLWQYHLLNHLDFPYTLLNGVTILYTVILLFTTPLWRKVLRRFSWVRTFGFTLLIWLPTELFFFFFNKEMAFLYVPVGAIQNFISVGLNFAYANILYLNMPEDQSTTLTAFNIVGCNLFALLGTISGTAISAISGDSTMSFLGMEIYSVQITVLVRAALIAIMGFVTFRYWRVFSPEQEIARLDRHEE